MKVSQAMTRTVHLASPDESVAKIAEKMAAEDLGFMPLGENDRLVGTITDRDIVLRVLARGKDGRTPAREAMSKEVKYCFEDEEMEHVVENMGDLQVRRLPVVDRDKRLVGVITLADAVLKNDSDGVGIAMMGIVVPLQG